MHRDPKGIAAKVRTNVTEKTLGGLVSETHFLRHACKERKGSLSPSPRLIPGHNQSLVSGVVLDIPSSHSEAGRDVLESMTSLSLTDIFK